jgi:hypothetical protein
MMKHEESGVITPRRPPMERLKAFFNGFISRKVKADVPVQADKQTVCPDMENNVFILWSQHWLIDFVDALLMRWCQLALMIGCILGTFGLYATSFNLTAQPAFNGIWAGIQAVSIDGLFFAVWSVWRRSVGKGWLRTWYFFIGVLLMIVAAMVNGVVSYTELHKVATIALTMNALHIDETMFSWSRSVLVVLVAVLITTLPRGAKSECNAPVAQQAVTLVPVAPAIDPAQLLQDIQNANKQLVQDLVSQFSQVTVQLVRETVQAQIATVTPVQQIEATVSHAETDCTVPLSEDENPIQGAISEDRQYKSSYSIQIENLYHDNPKVTPAQASKIVGCNYHTAKKWLERCKPVE